MALAEIADVEQGPARVDELARRRRGRGGRRNAAAARGEEDRGSTNDDDALNHVASFAPACGRPSTQPAKAGEARYTAKDEGRAKFAAQVARVMDSIDLKRRLTKKERGELEALMRVRDPQCAGAMECSITRLHGFLTSVVSGPMVVPLSLIHI